MRNMKIVVPTAVAAFVTLLAAGPGEAAPIFQPGDRSIDDCIYEGRHECPEGSVTCFCCFDDGCWICNDELEDCVWDPAARQPKKKLRIFQEISPQTLTPGTVEGGKKPKPPKVYQAPGTLAPLVQ